MRHRAQADFTTLSCCYTFGMVFVKLISCLLPFLYPVLEWRYQTFHENTTGTRQGWSLKHGSAFKHRKPQKRFQCKKRNKTDVEKCTCGSYFVKCLNFASMLRCRMHILVRAEPISLVAPWRHNIKTNYCWLFKSLHVEITNLIPGERQDETHYSSNTELEKSISRICRFFLLNYSGSNSLCSSPAWYISGIKCSKN